jgi:hypothetical protein
VASFLARVLVSLAGKNFYDEVNLCVLEDFVASFLACVLDSLAGNSLCGEVHLHALLACVQSSCAKPLLRAFLLVFLIHLQGKDFMTMFI